ncbi:hypothetical protein GCM10009760_17970 [Kitasatospora kazusensis]|uniref:DUF461 domain-containing protein n=1 Tax=Kitasatospora kazusensis TaxID=407974 RepID=A0ABP5L111_9ACTN
MSRSLRRGAIAALVLAAIVPLSACAAGNTPDTLEVKPDNASTSIGNTLKLNNIVVVTPADSVALASGPANLSVNISNSSSAPEALQSVTVGQGATASFTDAKGAAVTEIVIPAGGSVLLGGEGQPAAHLSSVALTVGGFTPTTFSFGNAGKVTTQAQVTPAKGQYAAFGPAAPLASASPSAAILPTGAASGAASAPATGAATASGAASAPATGAATVPTTPGAPASPSSSAH